MSITFCTHESQLAANYLHFLHGGMKFSSVVTLKKITQSSLKVAFNCCDLTQQPAKQH